MFAKKIISRMFSVVFVVVFLLVLSTSSIPTAQATTIQMDAHWGEMPLYFIANQGQMDNRVTYYVQGSDKTLYFTPEGVTFALTDVTDTDSSPLSLEERSETRGRWIVKLDFVDANLVQPSGQAQTEAVISYFKGSPEEWQTGLPTYSKITYSGLWKGVDLVYSGTVNRLKHEFVVRPGADPAQIRLTYRGATVQLNEAGQLEVSTPSGGFQDDVPLAYQEVNGQRVPVSVAYALENATYGFRVGAYDPNLPLVIDPVVLVYCGYIGGTGGDFSTGIDVDSNGNVYVTGYTDTTEATFPVTVGPDLTYNSTGTSDDAFVAKVNASGTGLVYAGYIGGNNRDQATGIAVDSDGYAYVTGFAESTQATFPVIGGPDLTHNGNDDAFVAKVNVDGTGLVYSGYIGGSQDDGGEAIALDADGNAYITGFTYSYPTNGFPVLVGPYVTHSGYTDAFVAKVKADGTGLLYAGYIGGGDTGTNGFDEGWGIAVDSDGNAYVTGITSSTEATFPVAVGPDLTYNGGPTTSPWDVFVAKVAADGSRLVYCGYIGGAQQDYGADIAVDSLGYAYVTGYTNSTEATFPVTVGPDLTYNGDYWDAFVVKVKVDGSGLIYAGYIGGSEGDIGSGIVLDAAGDAYITGYASSTEATFPVSGGPDLTHNGNNDAFVAKVKTDGSGLLYSGYIGGSCSDSGNAITLDSLGNIYIAGDTCSTQATFPATVGPDLTFSDYYDVFVAKIFSGTPPNTIFTDVPSTYWAWNYIERLYNAGITGGCNASPLMYCPEATVTRAQMAIFILRGIHGSAYVPPAATGTVFADVPLGSFAADWIEQFAAEGVTAGCGGGNYCPDATITRAQMAIFLLRGEHGSTYTPPAATGAVFGDVPLGSFADAWIEQLAAETITSGCGGGNYCPDANVTRAEMAVFLVRAFSLP